MIVMRTAGNSGGRLTTVRQEISALDPDVAISEAAETVVFISRHLNSFCSCSERFTRLVCARPSVRMSGTCCGWC
jgi:hypothetical protein